MWLEYTENLKDVGGTYEKNKKYFYFVMALIEVIDDKDMNL